MTQTLFQSSSLKDTFAALRADLLHEHGPRISTMRNYRFAIVQYEPAQEFALRGEVQRLAVELRKGGWFVLSISLRQLLLDRIRAEDEDFIERVTEMERRTSARDQARGREYPKSKLIPLIEGKGGLADECATMIRQHVKDHPERADRTLALIGRAGAIYPFFRSSALRGVGNFDRLEVVSNGLHPQGLTTEALQYIDRFVVSVYFDDSALSELWSRWLAVVAPHVELQLRLHADGWDRWTGDERVDEARAQQLYDACWYRKHCVTVERGRLFACSRIPKLARDAEGLPLTDDVTLASVTDYLNRNRFLPSCQTCVPMIELGTVTPGVQPDGRLVRLTTRAIRVLAARVSAAESQSGADP